MEMDKILRRCKVEKDHEWHKWINEIPWLQFPSGWLVRPVPPFGGAVARFHVKKGDDFVSIYLDCYDQLGIVGEPYWEVYPYQGDCARFLMNDTDGLLKCIQEILDNKQL